MDNYTTAGAAVYDVMDQQTRDFALQTQRQFRSSNNRIESGSEAELAAVLKRYAESDIIISSALHGCIIGAAMGRKVIAVSGDRKIEAFMDAIDLGGWVCDITQLDSFMQRLSELETQLPVSDVIIKSALANREVAKKILRAAGLSNATLSEPAQQQSAVVMPS